LYYYDFKSLTASVIGQNKTQGESKPFVKKKLQVLVND